MDFESYFISAMEKIVPGVAPGMKENEGFCFENESFSFQFAYNNHETELFFDQPFCKIESHIKEHIRVRIVEEVPCSLPVRRKHDHYYLTETPAYLPDLLKEGGPITMRFGMWKSLYLTYDGGAMPGVYPIKLSLYLGKDNLAAEATYTLTVLPGRLPKAAFDYTNWFSYESIAAYHEVAMYSRRYREILWNYVDNAVAHQMNRLYVQLFQPPFPFYHKGKRLDRQLLKIKKSEDGYVFDFEDVFALLKGARNHGIEKFEFEHLFSQWGAVTPPLIVDEDGNALFGDKGKEEDATYIPFLKQLLSEFAAKLLENGFTTKSILFHLSDEPHEHHLERMKSLHDQLIDSIAPFEFTDALSHYAFFEKGAVDHPIVALEFTPDYFAHQKKDILVYYCCGQSFDHMSNRFISMPLQRTRVIGVQLYITGVKGLLQWGFNNYRSGYWPRFVDPYLVNDADGNFQSGDAFIVYPTKEGGVLDSIRHEALLAGFNDYRALQMLEAKIGRPAVIQFLKDNGMEEDFFHYPTNPEWIVNLRKLINDRILN